MFAFMMKNGFWFLTAGLITVFLSSAYLYSGYGLAFFICGLLLLVADPAVLFAGKKSADETTAGVDKNLFFAWGLAVLALVLFFTRSLLAVPAEAVLSGQESMIGRVRLILLLLFILATCAALIYRLAISLSFGSTQAATFRAESGRMMRQAFVSILAAIPLFILVNYVVAGKNPTLDLSPGYFSFSESSRTVIRSFDRDVKIYVFLPVQQYVRSDRAATPTGLFRIAEDVRLLMEQLPLINPRISVEFKNADIQSEAASEFGNVNNGTIIMRAMNPGSGLGVDDRPYTERRAYVYNESDLEKLQRDVVRSLVQISSPQNTVYFTSVNGERYDWSDERRRSGGIEELKEMLRFYNFQLRKLDPATGWPGEIPDDADVLFIAGPSVPFSERARESVLDYIGRGGNVFVAIDPYGQEDFNWLLEATNSPFQYRPAFLSHIPSDPGIVITNQAEDHRITESLSIAGSSYVVFPGTGYFEDTGNPPGAATSRFQNFTESKIIHTPFNTVVDESRTGRQSAGEQTGRFLLGLALSDPDDESEQGNGASSSKIAMYGSINWITDAGLRFPVDQRNIILATDTLFWMTENPLAAAIPPQTRESRNIEVTSVTKMRNFVLGIVLFPLLMSLGMGIAIFVYRKKRKFIGEAL